MKIYLDYNILLYLKNKEVNETNTNLEELEKKIDNYKLNGHCFFFSPAHLEELAVSKRHYDVDDKIINSDLEYFNNFFGNNSIRPRLGGNISFRTEYPSACYSRAIKDSKPNDYAELISEERLKRIKLITNNGKIKNNSENVFDKHDYEVLLCELNIILPETDSDAIVYRDKNTLSLILNCFELRQNAIEVLSHIIELKNFYPEKMKNFRSRLYDIGHIIYASYTELFITNDAKLLQKAKIIYDFLNIKTKVLSLKELLSN